MKCELVSKIILGAFLAASPAAAVLAQNAETRPPALATTPYQETADDYNRRIAELNGQLAQQVPGPPAVNDRADYRIGPDDQLDISVFEAPELDRAPRVSASGEISLALIGTVRAAGLTNRELETVIEELLRHSYIKEPHVNVQVREMQSHAVAVFGAVKKPGVFQVRGPKTVVELLSMAEGLDVDAGEQVIVEHRSDGAALNSFAAVEKPVDVSGALVSSTVDASSGRSAALVPSSEESTAPGTVNPSVVAAGFPNTVEIDLKKLLGTGDPRLNVLVYPGDVVKVPRADLVYVIGEVAKPGGFELKSNESVSVLQAIALAQGLTHTSSSAHSRIIRTNAAGERQEIPIDINNILAGRSADPVLEPRDIVFVPNSASRTALYRGVDAIFSIGSGVAVYRW